MTFSSFAWLQFKKERKQYELMLQNKKVNIKILTEYKEFLKKYKSNILKELKR